MIKIKIYELDKHRNETTLRPLLFAKELFYDVGIEFVTDGKCDFAFVGQASVIDKKLSIKDSVEKGIKFLKNVKEPFFIFDGQDAASLIGIYELFDHVNPIYVFKNSLYKNKEDYLLKSMNGRSYWPTGNYYLPNLNHFNKIKLSHSNWLSTIIPKWSPYEKEKNFDVCALFGRFDKEVLEHIENQSPHYNSFRQLLLDNLDSKYNTIKLTNGIRFSQSEYYNHMFNSKILLSPFGCGEIAIRDLESIMFGNVLIKPDMSHIDTLPNVYIDNETYIACKHDFSDINEKIDYVLSDYKNIQEKLTENFRKLYKELYSRERLVMYYYDIFKNLNGVTTE